MKEFNVCDEEYYMKHRNILSMGNGDTSLIRMYQLMDRLRDSFETLCGLQQIPVKDADPEHYFQIKILARDIAMALTGKDIEFQEHK